MNAVVSTAERQQHRWLRSDTLADSVTIMFALTAVQRLVGFGRSLLFCFWLDPQELGQWDIAFGFLMLAAPIAVLSLPGTFGRYVEYYRHRGQLRTFLGRITAASVALAILSASVVWLRGDWFSELIFGKPNRTDLIGILALTLLAVIAFNFVAELFTALRLQRVASTLEFMNSALFAIFGVGLICFWHRSAASVVLAYGAACLVSTSIALVHVWRKWTTIPITVQPIKYGEFWGKLIPFIASVWIINWLGNLFGMVDRYMILHYSGLSATESMSLIGQYHTSRVIPQLLIAVASLLAGILLPYLSHEWEMGNRSSVSERLNLVIKLSGVSLFSAAVLIQALAPWLYQAAFADKFDEGLAVIPWILLSSVWFGMISIAKVYLWCDEKVRLVSLSFLLGLLVMVLMDLRLLPSLGLFGAVLGTCLANFAALSAIYGFSCWRGMRLHVGTLLVTFLPLSLTLGTGLTVAVLSSAAILSVVSELLFSQKEKAQVISVLRRYYELSTMRFSKSKVLAMDIEGARAP